MENNVHTSCMISTDTVNTEQCIYKSLRNGSLFGILLICVCEPAQQIKANKMFLRLDFLSIFIVSQTFVRSGQFGPQCLIVKAMSRYSNYNFLKKGSYINRARVKSQRNSGRFIVDSHAKCVS